MGVLDDAIREHLDLKRQRGAADTELERQEAEALGPARREVPAEPVEEGEGAAGEPLDEQPAPVAEPASFAEPEPEPAPFAEEPAIVEPPLPVEEPAAAEEPAFFEAPEAFEEPVEVEEAPAALEEEPVPVEEPAAVEEDPASYLEEPVSSEEPTVLEEPAPAEEASFVEEAPLEPEEIAAAEAGEPPSPAGDTPPRGFPPAEDEPVNPLDQPTQEHPPPPPPGETGEADVLEETPDFLEETPEHDRLWFEQKPPRDFDFDE